jgi:hypothetical protein
MVSLLERTISLGGLLSLYTYGVYKFIKVKSSFDAQFHKSAEIQAEKFIMENKNNNLKFASTKDKLLFLYGIENNSSCLSKDNLELIDKIVENFTPNFFVYEKEIKNTNKTINDHKNVIITNLKKIMMKNNSEIIINDVIFNTNENLLKHLIELEDESKYELINLLKNEISDKDLPFNLFNSICEYKRQKLAGGKISYIYSGLDYYTIKSIIRKRLKNLSSDETDSRFEKNLSMSDISKMSLKERINFKEWQQDINSKYSIYEDIKHLIDKEMIETGEGQILNSQQIFDDIVIAHGNEILINNFLDNKKLYLALVIVRKERLDNLYEKMTELNKINV